MRDEVLFSVNGLDTSKFKPEPTEDEIEKYMKEHNENYYCSREKLREEAYGGKPPAGYNSWGDFWKCGV